MLPVYLTERVRVININCDYNKNEVMHPDHRPIMPSPTKQCLYFFRIVQKQLQFVSLSSAIQVVIMCVKSKILNQQQLSYNLQGVPKKRGISV